MSFLWWKTTPSITPSLSGSILPGITRNSVLRLLNDNGYHVEERRVAIQEVADWYNGSVLSDAFGTGTAATIAHIAVINLRRPGS